MSAANIVDSSGWLEYLTDSDRASFFAAARHPLPLADSIIYATALRHEATFWIQDEHFKDLPNVRNLPRDK